MRSDVVRFYRLVVKTQRNVMGGPHFGTRYSLDSACPHCGTGAEPTGPRYVARLSATCPAFITLDGDVLVSSTVAQALEQVGVSSLSEVRQVSTGRPLPYMELRWSRTLPPFSGSTTGYERERPCPACGRDGYFEVLKMPLRLVYDKIDASFRKEHVLATFERFGNSRLRSPFNDSVIAGPLYIVSEMVMDCLRKLRVRNIDFEDVGMGTAKARNVAGEAKEGG